MAAEDRSLSNVLEDVIRNVQEIVRSEVRLAKTEIREEAARGKSAMLLLGAGAVTAIFAILFLLLMIVHTMALVMPSWAAALIVGSALALVASVMLPAGVRRFKHIPPTRERTVGTMKEHVEWAKQHTK